MRREQNVHMQLCDEQTQSSIAASAQEQVAAPPQAEDTAKVIATVTCLTQFFAQCFSHNHIYFACIYINKKVQHSLSWNIFLFCILFVHAVHSIPIGEEPKTELWDFAQLEAKYGDCALWGRYFGKLFSYVSFLCHFWLFFFAWCVECEATGAHTPHMYKHVYYVFIL